MNIFVDESGLFVQTANANSFSAVIAYVISEEHLGAAEAALRRYKRRACRKPSEEVKASETTEDNYLAFLAELGGIDGIVTGVVSDGSLQGDIENHKEQQARKLDDYVQVMVYEEGKAMVARAASDIRRLSNQNYVELHCRAHLAWDVVRRGTLYFVQRNPAALHFMRWSFDAKDVQKNHFESTLADLLGTLTQAHSMERPLIQLLGADYSHFERFSAEDQRADWFPIPDEADMTVMNSLMFREHMEFVDSKMSAGVQIADLIANGLTRCLRGRFEKNDVAAALLGRLMTSEPGGVPSVDFVLFEGGDGVRVLDRDVARRVRIMDRNAKSMVAK